MSCRTSRVRSPYSISITGVSPSSPVFPKTFIYLVFRFPYIRFLQFRSSLLSESFLLSFPLPTKIFQFGRSCLSFDILVLLTRGFSHSDSSGSLCTYHSPKRFAVRRVLLRLLVPRHPLCALTSLTFSLFFDFSSIYFSKISSEVPSLVPQNCIRLPFSFFSLERR